MTRTSGIRAAAIAALTLLTCSGIAFAAAPDSATWRVTVDDLAIDGWHDAEAGSTLYTLHRGDAEIAGPTEARYELQLRYKNFDPLRDGAPAVPDSFANAATSIYFVQFLTRPLPEYRTKLDELGVKIHKYFPYQSYLAEIPADRVAAVRDLSFVRWVGAYQPIFRTEPFVAQALSGGDALGTRTYNLRFFEASDAIKETIAQRIESIGGEVVALRDGKFMQRATLNADQVRTVLGWDELMYLDRWSPLQPDMDIVRNVGGANFLEDTPEGYTGVGVRGEVFDSGFNTSHIDFSAMPLIEHNNVSGGSHGAATSGIIFGDGTHDSRSLGLIPDAQGIVGDYNLVGLDSPARYDYTAELKGAPYFAVFQSCSAGSDRTELYSNISAGMDTLLFDLDILACQSQSNAGDQDSRPQAWAKNIVAVGGVKHKDTQKATDDEWDRGASIGPAEDGRVKPDLAAYYDSVFTTSWPGSEANTEFSGTSAATPIVCGHVGLFFQMWSDGLFGNSVDPTATVFENRSHMTTAKAALVNTARQWDWRAGGNNSDIEREVQGWGFPNTKGLYGVRDKTFVVDEADVLENLETTEYLLTVADGERFFKATLVYADPAGNPAAQIHRVNNLSLEVISPSGTQYWGNYGLRQRLWSEPDGFENDVDTVENVFLQNPEAGEWTVRIHASEIVEDGHVETAAVDADYALWVSGVSR